MAAKCGITIEEHLRGLVEKFDLSDTTISAILMDAGVSEGMPVSELSREQLDLAVAHLYLWCLHFLPYSKNNTKDADGGWEHTEGGYQLLAADRERWWAYLRWLWRRWRWPWLEELLDEEKSSKVVVFNL